MRSRCVLFLVCLGACSASPEGTSVPIPGGGGGIGFDDLRYSAALHRVLAPAGRTGTLAVVDPDSLAVATVPGFSTSGSYDGGHDFGATSVDEGRGLLFVTDRTTQTLDVVDPSAGAIIASAALGSSPDYVRWVAATGELWVTEPASSRIEVFSVSADAVPVVASVATVPVDNGPESLVVDQSTGRAYTHRWESTTVVFDVRSRAQVAEWPNGCAASRGLAVDETRGFFFAGCNEGTVSVLDTAHGGAILSTIARGAGFDVMGYSPALGHLYLAGTACSCLAVLGVSAAGSLSFLGRFDATSSAHCAAADDRGHAWVCDPDGGRLLRVDDPYPASG
jgi:DNA-binding beta-propeller fold protein YncE